MLCVMSADIFGALHSAYLPLPALLKVTAPLLIILEGESVFRLAVMPCRRRGERHKLASVYGWNMFFWRSSSFAQLVCGTFTPLAPRWSWEWRRTCLVARDRQRILIGVTGSMGLHLHRWSMSNPDSRKKAHNTGNQIEEVTGIKKHSVGVL